MNVPGKRILLGSAVVMAALGVGGIAYAANNDPTPEQGYVTIEDGATTPSPGTQNGDSTQGYGTPPGSNSQEGTNGRGDCPEKNGSGQQGESQPSQPQETQPSQPQQTQPEQDQAENA
jgi:hypothetical protein